MDTMAWLVVFGVCLFLHGAYQLGFNAGLAWVLITVACFFIGGSFGLIPLAAVALYGLKGGLKTA